MTKEELLEALRAAKGPSRVLDVEIGKLLTSITKIPIGFLPKFTTSIDATEDFRERTIPGSRVLAENLNGRWKAEIRPNATKPPDMRFTWNVHFFGQGATEALSRMAACIATLIYLERK